jgi:hypothetical protein
MARSIGFDHVSATATSFVWDLNEVAERNQLDTWERLPLDQLDVLVVGGGGGGGNYQYGGGGGAGGFLATTGATVTNGIPYTVTIGNGGPAGSNGGSSSFKDSAETLNLVAIGGGHGAAGVDANGNPGGSGGGATGNYPPGTHGTGGGSTANGNPGGDGAPNNRAGGGGGAGEPGVPGLPRPRLVGTTAAAAAAGFNPINQKFGTSGGDGAPNVFKDGTSIIYAGGGSGRYGDTGITYPVFGGGGGGSLSPGTPGSPGTDGLGGGGGKQASGGKGVVIIRYPQEYPDISFTSGAATRRTYSTFKSYEFTSNAVIQFN